jgi:hypothetical protein
MFRLRLDGTKDVTTVILGRKEIPRGTLRNILRLAGVSDPEFIRALRKGRRRR